MKREHHVNVYLNRSEVNEANEKKKKIGLKKLPDLFRLAIKNLDADLQAEILLLKARVNELVNDFNSMLLERDKSNTDAALYKHNAEYWETFGTRLINEKEELQEKIVELTNMVGNQATTIAHQEDYLKQRNAKVAELVNDNGELRRLRESDNQLGLKLEQQIKDLTSQRDEFEKLLHAETDASNRGLETHMALRKEFDKIAEIVGCKGAKQESIAPRVQEVKNARDKYNTVRHDIAKIVELPENEWGKEGAITQKVKNVKAERENHSHIRRDYFVFLCEMLGFGIDEKISVFDFGVAFKNKFRKKLRVKIKEQLSFIFLRKTKGE